MSVDAEIKGVIPSYYGFLITGLTQIREYWAKRMYVEGMEYALHFTTFLPRKIKKALSEEKQRITLKLTGNSKGRVHNFYELQKSRSKYAYMIAAQELEPYMDKMTTLLDENHLLTQQYGVPTKARSMKEFQMTVDHATYEAEKGETS